MPDNYIMQSVIEDVDVRLVGIIDDHDCTALLNTDDTELARKISTSASVDFNDYAPYVVAGKKRRFVLVVRSKSKRLQNNKPIIFISPVIHSGHYEAGAWVLFCEPTGNAHSELFRFKEKNK